MPSVQPSKRSACSSARKSGAVLGAVLLVGGEGQHDVAARADPGTGPGADGGEHHRVHVLHVDGAAAPHDAVADLAGEGVDAPVGGLGGHHVEVAVHEQGVGGRVGAGDAGHDVGPAGGGLQQRGLDARASASRSATYSAAGRSTPSPPPRLVVSMRIRSEVNVTTSSSACWSMCSAILLLHRCRDDRRDRLERADSFVHVRRRVGHATLTRHFHPGHHSRGAHQVLGVELQLHRVRPRGAGGAVRTASATACLAAAALMSAAVRAGVRQTAAYRET